MAVQVLFGLQQRTRQGVKTDSAILRAVGNDARAQQAASLAALEVSDSRGQRADRGEDPAVLGRTDIEFFLSRLAYLHAGGQVSELTRVLACREVRTLLTAARALGATRPGGPAAGLSDQFALGPGDMPDEP